MYNSLNAKIAQDVTLYNKFFVYLSRHVVRMWLLSLYTCDKLQHQGRGSQDIVSIFVSIC